MARGAEGGLRCRGVEIRTDPGRGRPQSHDTKVPNQRRRRPLQQLLLTKAATLHCTDNRRLVPNHRPTNNHRPPANHLFHPINHLSHLNPSLASLLICGHHAQYRRPLQHQGRTHHLRARPRPLHQPQSRTRLVQSRPLCPQPLPRPTHRSSSPVTIQTVKTTKKTMATAITRIQRTWERYVTMSGVRHNRLGGIRVCAPMI